MANWFYGTQRVIADAETKQAVRDFLTQSDEVDCESLIPTPETLLTKAEKADWRERHWGVRHFVLARYNEENGTYYISTKNSPPLGIIHALSKRFPGKNQRAQFHFMYGEEGNQEQGFYTVSNGWLMAEAFYAQEFEYEGVPDIYDIYDAYSEHIDKSLRDVEEWMQNQPDVKKEYDPPF